MKRILTLSAALAFAAGISAQNPSHGVPVQPKYFYTPLSKLTTGDYLENTIILKVNPQFRSACSENLITLPAVSSFFNMIGVDHIAKIFPFSKIPQQSKNKWGQPMVDLTLIYEVHYTSGIQLENAIGKLYAMGFFEYVQPHFIPKTTLTTNDPSATQAQQYNIYKIAAAGAGTTGWNISQGDTNTVIGVVDTGTQPAHLDLAGNLKHNYADPVNGIDDDGDGYVDNFSGWDMGMNDNDPTWQGSAHGVHVCGIAAAVTNNSNGVAGVGYKCKFLPVKGADSGGNLTQVYPGIVYAADHGAKVINCSWGGAGGGSYEQSIIDYATNNDDALVVAAAGNNNLDEAFFPAALDKVISVAATDNTDTRASFSDYNYTVDVCAPGKQIYSTWSGSNSYLTLDGTSMASPCAAGVAGVIRSFYPSYNAIQAGERMKQTADNIYSINPAYVDKLGTGRVNMYRALTDAATPSVIYSNIVADDHNDEAFVGNDTLRISGDFTNYLGTSGNLTATLSVVSGGSYVTLQNTVVNIGVMGSIVVYNNAASPFTVKINTNAPVNQQIDFKVHITDGTYSTNQFFSEIVNVDYINITVNDVWTTITSKGLIGYNQTNQAQGLGFDYQHGGTLLYESGFMVGVSATKVDDMIRGNPNTDVDFQSVTAVRQVVPAVVSDFDVDGKFNDAVSTTSGPLPVTVHHKAFAWTAVPHSKYVIVQYTIANTGATSLSNLFAGVFADWDIDGATYNNDKADFDAANKMGYAYCTNANGKYCGIKLLTNSAPVVHYAIDNVSGGAGGINIFDGFATNEKYTALSTNRQQAGTGSPTGNDVCDMVSSGPFTIAAGDSIVVAFALIAGDNLADIQASAGDAQTMYDGNITNATANIDNVSSALSIFPNPSSGATQIQYSIAEAGNVKLDLYDASGRLVRTLSTGTKPAGNYVVQLDAETLTDGVYFIRLVSGKNDATRKIVIMH